MIGKKVTIIFPLSIRGQIRKISINGFHRRYPPCNHQWLGDRCQHQTDIHQADGKSVDGRWLGRLEARAKRDPRMETEGDAVGVRRNEPRCCQLTGTTRIEHVTRVSFLFTLHYTATMKRGNRFLLGLQHPREIGSIGSAEQPRACLPRGCSSAISMMIRFPSAIRRLVPRRTHWGI